MNQFDKFPFFCVILITMCYFELLSHILQWNVLETADKYILPHAVTPNRPSMKKNLLHWSLLIFVRIKRQIRK